MAHIGQGISYILQTILLVLSFADFTSRMYHVVHFYFNIVFNSGMFFFNFLKWVLSGTLMATLNAFFQFNRCFSRCTIFIRFLTRFLTLSG